MKANRAYYYMGLMDLWGNIPIVTKVGEPEMPATNSRQEVFEFIESEMLAVIEESSFIIRRGTKYRTFYPCCRLCNVGDSLFEC